MRTFAVILSKLGFNILRPKVLYKYDRFIQTSHNDYCCSMYTSHSQKYLKDYFAHTMPEARWKSRRHDVASTERRDDAIWKNHYRYPIFIQDVNTTQVTYSITDTHPFQLMCSSISLANLRRAISFSPKWVCSARLSCRG